jgi:hypothetical protein
MFEVFNLQGGLQVGSSKIGKIPDLGRTAIIMDRCPEVGISLRARG